LAGRPAPATGPTLEVVSDTSKEPQRTKNGRGGAGRNAREGGTEGGGAEPTSA
jgi:hypothetical protein